MSKPTMRNGYVMCRKLEKEDSMSAGGIILSAQTDNQERYEVVSANRNVPDGNGTMRPCAVREGDVAVMQAQPAAKVLVDLEGTGRKETLYVFFDGQVMCVL